MTISQSHNIVFLCTGNACRSQMAEALARHLLPDSVAVHSAGIVAHGMNSCVEEVMAEMGISLEGHYSKSIAELELLTWDLVVTVCDNAADSCPSIPAKCVIHNSFPDPPAMAEQFVAQQEKLDCYRQVRDQIHLWLETQDLLKYLVY